MIQPYRQIMGHYPENQYFYLDEGTAELSIKSESTYSLGKPTGMYGFKIIDSMILGASKYLDCPNRHINDRI